jgi:CRISPR/Cas system CSM-associated protein Csm5 (group 7 of RAMP superfamily)
MNNKIAKREGEEKTFKKSFFKNASQKNASRSLMRDGTKMEAPIKRTELEWGWGGGWGWGA